MANEILKMNLDQSCICLDLQSQNRDEAIGELVGLLHIKHKFESADEVLRVILEREKKMSTAIENGVAVPRAKTALVKKPMVAVGIGRKGIDFKSTDGRPTQIIVSVISPSSGNDQHMRCLAEITRLMQSEGTRKKIIEAKDTETIYRIMSETGE